MPSRYGCLIAPNGAPALATARVRHSVRDWTQIFYSLIYTYMPSCLGSQATLAWGLIMDETLTDLHSHSMHKYKHSYCHQDHRRTAGNSKNHQPSRPAQHPNMSSTTTNFSPLHRALGLSIATSYALLGASAVFAPNLELSLLGLAPSPSTPAADASLRDAMLLLGVRDWSISVALFWFYARREGRSMGVVVLSGMVLCVADVMVVWRRRGGDWVAVGLGVGAAVWGWVGWELVGL